MPWLATHPELCSVLWCDFPPLNLTSFQLLRGLFLFVLSSRAFAENDEIWRHFCLTFINCVVGIAAACHPFSRKLRAHAQSDTHNNTQSISLSLTVGSCHDEGYVAPSLLPVERSEQVHAYITQTLTAAALSAKREKGTDIWREGAGKREERILVYRRRGHIRRSGLVSGSAALLVWAEGVSQSSQPAECCLCLPAI